MSKSITIIGAGPGGYETAAAAAEKGFDVTLITDGPLGGTCLNEGCIPTKCLCRNAEVLEDFAHSEEYGITASYSFDFKKAVERKEAVISQLRSGIEFLLKKVRIIEGKASFKDSHTVLVGEEEIESDYIIIATGSVSALLPIPGNDLEGVITSKELLSIDAIPRRLCIIGAGVIGLEFASIFNSFGSEVTVLEYCPNVLPRFDIDLAKRLKQSLSKKGISIITSAKVESIEHSPGGLEVKYQFKDNRFSILSDKVLMAVGRRPNLKSLNFDEIGIETTPKGVVVNNYMQTSVPNIYAIGDITGGMMLAHVATFQGRRVLNHLTAGCPSEGPVDKIQLDLVPAAVFTSPEVATIGKTEEECKAEGVAFKIRKSFYRANGKALSMNSPDGYCKIIEEEKSGRILGCHIIGSHASDLIQEVTALISMDGNIYDLSSIIHAHPTLSEIVLNAAD